MKQYRKPVTDTLQLHDLCQSFGVNSTSSVSDPVGGNVVHGGSDGLADKDIL